MTPSERLHVLWGQLAALGASVELVELDGPADPRCGALAAGAVERLRVLTSPEGAAWLFERSLPEEVAA